MKTTNRIFSTRIIVLHNLGQVVLAIKMYSPTKSRNIEARKPWTSSWWKGSWSEKIIITYLPKTQKDKLFKCKQDINGNVQELKSLPSHAVQDWDRGWETQLLIASDISMYLESEPYYVTVQHSALLEPAEELPQILEIPCSGGHSPQSCTSWTPHSKVTWSDQDAR